MKIIIILLALAFLLRELNLLADDDYYVYGVRQGSLDERTPLPNTTDKVEVGLGNFIWVDVVELDKWLDSNRTKLKLNKNEGSPEKLVLFLDGIPLKGDYVQNPGSLDDSNFFSSQIKTRHLRFALNRDPQDLKSAWLKILQKPTFKKRLSVSIGFEDGEEMPTKVIAEDVQNINPFYLNIIPVGKGIIGLILIGGAIFIFLYLAKNTDILRDTTGLIRPDNSNAFSLARTQMAFWFFLVVTSFFLLWVITGDTNTITNSMLVLIGISASTALGSAVIDAGKTSVSERAKNVVPASILKGDNDQNKPENEICDALKLLRSACENDLSANVESSSKVAIGDQAGINANQKQFVYLTDRLSVLNWQITFYSMNPWKRVMYDLLGDREAISFHRFQIFIWTIVLGLIFIYDVYDDLAMPDFSATLLGLLGISAGTFIGFKLPDQKA